MRVERRKLLKEEEDDDGKVMECRCVVDSAQHEQNTHGERNIRPVGCFGTAGAREMDREEKGDKQRRAPW